MHDFQGVGLLASNYTTLLGQPATRIRHVGALSVSGDGHVVVLPSALEVVPGRAHEAELSRLVVDDSLELHLRKQSVCIRFEGRTASGFKDVNGGLTSRSLGIPSSRFSS